MSGFTNNNNTSAKVRVTVKESISVTVGRSPSTVAVRGTGRPGAGRLYRGI